MYRLLALTLVLVLLSAGLACTRRMSPFSPHRPNTQEHRAAQTNQACLGCHELRAIPSDHHGTDDCLKCHRILQGE